MDEKLTEKPAGCALRAMEPGLRLPRPVRGDRSFRLPTTDLRCAGLDPARHQGEPGKTISPVLLVIGTEDLFLQTLDVYLRVPTRDPICRGERYLRQAWACDDQATEDACSEGDANGRW